MAGKRKPLYCPYCGTATLQSNVGVEFTCDVCLGRFQLPGPHYYELQKKVDETLETIRLALLAPHEGQEFWRGYNSALHGVRGMLRDG